jgi:hypothetical protein
MASSLDRGKQSPRLLNRDRHQCANPHNRGEQTNANQYDGEILGRLTNNAARVFRHKPTKSLRHTINKATLHGTMMTLILFRQSPSQN